MIDRKSQIADGGVASLLRLRTWANLSMTYASSKSDRGACHQCVHAN